MSRFPRRRHDPTNGQEPIPDYEPDAELSAWVKAEIETANSSEDTVFIEFFNKSRLQNAISKMRSQRVAMVGLGDSNQLLSGHGWSEGMAKIFGRKFGWFGSGVIRNRFGTPDNSGVFIQKANSTTVENLSTLPEELDKYIQSKNQNLFWLASGESLTHNGVSNYYLYSNGVASGITYPADWDLGGAHKMDVSYITIARKYKTGLTATDAVWQSGNTVRFSITEDLGRTHEGMYVLTSAFANASNNGTFEITAVGAGYVDCTTARGDATDDETGASASVDIEQDAQTAEASEIRTYARRASSPYSSMSFPSDVQPTLADDYGVADLTNSVSADPSRSVWDKVQGGFSSVGETIVGPVLLTGMQMTNPDITSGIAQSTLVYQGGESMQDFYDGLYGTDDALLIEFWRQVRLNLNGDKSAFVTINGGLNDRNESRPSPINGYAGDSPEAYKERVELIIDRLIATWTAIDEMGGRGDQEDLTIMVMVSHPISTPEDSQLESYREVAKFIPANYPNVGFVTISELVPQQDFVDNGYYRSGGADTNHLERLGYQNISQAILDYLK